MAWLGIARYRRAEDGFVIAREALRYAQEGWWDKAPTARPVSLALANFFSPLFSERGPVLRHRRERPVMEGEKMSDAHRSFSLSYRTCLPD